MPIAVALLSTSVAWAGPYSPAAGVAGSNAIAAADLSIQGWATGVVSLSLGRQDISNASSPLAAFGLPENALGKSDATPADPGPVISLGDGGSITLSFALPITNGAGADFAVFENSFDGTFLELAFVEVSSDGVNFFRFASHSLTQTSAQVNQASATTSIDPTNIDGLAGKFEAGFGTPFDLQSMAGTSLLLDINAVTQVRIVDVVGSLTSGFSTTDSDGHVINDPWKTPFSSGGFDLDAVGVIHQIPEPGAFIYAGIGLGVLLAARRRKPARASNETLGVHTA